MHKSKNFYVLLHTSASVISALILLVACPFALSIFGSKSGNSAFIVAATMIGIMVGQSGRFSIFQFRGIFFLTGAFSLLLYAFYGETVILAAESPAFRCLALAYILILPICSGILVSNAIYNNSDVTINYFFHNSLCFIGILFYIAFRLELGMAVPHLLIGIFLIILAVATTFFERVEIQKAKFTFAMVNKEALLLGLVSGGYSACLLQSISSWILPTGFEFSIYLSGVFLLLALASIVKIPFLVNLGMKPIWPVLFFTVILCVFVGGLDISVWLDPLAIYSYFPFLKYENFLQIVLFISALLMPYGLFSFMLPALEKRVKNYNNLFSISFGNTISLLFFSIAIPNLDIQLKVFVLYLLTFVCQIKIFKKMTAGFLVALILGILLNSIFLNNGDARAAIQASRSFQRNISAADYSFKTLLESPYSLENLKFFKKKGFETSFMFLNLYDSQYLGLDGYLARMQRKKDFWRAQIVSTILKNSEIHRILVLGLGGQIILDQINSDMQKFGNRKIEVEIVDNFKMFEELEFRNSILGNFAFKWPAENFKLVIDDAFTYLVQKKYERPFDLIVSNLTFPNHPSSNKLYTREFRKMLGHALQKNGIFITEFFSNSSLTCLDLQEFQYSYFSADDYRAASLVFSNRVLPELSKFPLSQFLKKEDCSKYQNLTLERPFVTKLIENYRDQALPPSN